MRGAQSTGIRTEVSDGVAWITIDNEAKRNALTLSIQTDLGEALTRLDRDGSVRAIVVRGSGTTSFSAGADVTEFAQQRSTKDARNLYERAVVEAESAWSGLRTPVIAMIHGHCFGAGLNIALSADLRMCDEAARFGIPAARLGLGYRIEAVQLLVATVGRSWAAELLLTGRSLDASEALAAGLVSCVVKAEALEDHVADFASTIARNAPLSTAAAKAAVRACTSTIAPDAAASVRRMIEACFQSRDYREGQAAFRERRTPQFVGS